MLSRILARIQAKPSPQVPLTHPPLRYARTMLAHTHTSRRAFLSHALLTSTAGALALSSLPRAAAARLVARASASRFLAPPSYYTAKPLVTGPTTITAILGDGGNSLLAGGDAWALIVDTKNPPLAAMLRTVEAPARAVNFADPNADRLVVNTHHHADHTGGNWAFDSIPIAAHEAAKPRILAQTKNYLAGAPSAIKLLEGSDKSEAQAALPFAKDYLAKGESFAPQAWAPTRTLADHAELKIGPLALRTHHYVPAHTDNDIIVHLPEHNIIHMGDLLFHKNWCVIDRSAKADTLGWIACIHEAIKLCDPKTIVIPGHGDLTDVEGLKGQIKFLERARALVADAIKAGSSRDDVIKLEPEEFADLGLKQIRPRTLGNIFDELTGAPAPTPASPAPAPAPAPAPPAPTPPAAQAPQSPQPRP